MSPSAELLSVAALGVSVVVAASMVWIAIRVEALTRRLAAVSGDPAVLERLASVERERDALSHRLENLTSRTDRLGEESQRCLQRAKVRDLYADHSAPGRWRGYRVVMTPGTVTWSTRPTGPSSWPQRPQRSSRWSEWTSEVRSTNPVYRRSPRPYTMETWYQLAMTYVTTPTALVATSWSRRGSVTAHAPTTPASTRNLATGS